WINPSSWGDHNSGRIAARANDTEPTVGWDFHIDSGKLVFEFGFGPSSHTEWITTTSVLSRSAWQQVAVVFDSTAVTPAARIFVDGEEMAVIRRGATTTTTTPPGDDDLPLSIGNHARAQPNQPSAFRGRIDDVRIYGSMLDEDELLAQMVLGRTPSFTVTSTIQRPGVLANDNNGTSRGVLLRAERDLVARATTAGGSVKMDEDGTFTYTPRANFFGTDTFTYRISDGLEVNGQTVWSEPVTVTLNVLGQPDAPEIVGGGQSRMELSVPEGQTDVGVLTATDVDDTPSSPDTRTWEILTQTANGFSRDWERFSIDASTGRLSLRAPMDFETPQSAARSNTYDIAVRVTDSTNRPATQNVVVSVTNVVEPPQADADTATAEYNTARTINVLANDSSPERRNLGVLDSERGKVERDEVTYTPTADQSGVSETFRYRIYDGSEGLVHYWRMDETVVSVIGTATGTTSALTDTPGAFGRALSFNGIDSAVTLPSIAYHSTGWSFSFWFKLDDLDGSGVRTFFDHGTPGASTGRADRLSVMAFEANHADESLRNQLRTRLLMGETEVALDIPLAGSGASLLGGWHAYTVTASPTSGLQVFIDDTPIRSSNTPIASFRPEGTAYFGRSTSNTSPDRLRGAMDTVALWQRVLSAGDVADWVRGDRTLSTVTVNINARPPEPPRITSFEGRARATVDRMENELFIAQVQADDQDLSTPASDLRYSIDPGPHAGLFTIDASSGRLSWSVAPNYENPPVSFTPRTYEVSVRVTDGTRSAAQLITVNLTDADEFDVSGLADADTGDNVINQGAAVGTAVGVRMQAVDGDGTTNSVRYSLADDAGGLFMIDRDDQFTGVIRLAARIGIDPPPEYQLRVVATSADGSRVEAPVTIKVERIPNRGPVMPAEVLLKIPENTRDVTVVQASDDAVPQPLSYRLAGGPDVGLFELNEATGELRLKQPADAERPLDANGDNRYELSVEAFDGLLTALQSIVLSIDNVDEAPSWAVNQMTITNGQVQLQIRADDVDTRADRLSYTVSEASGGWFAPSSSSSTRLGSFTQAQVQSGEVVFRLDGSGRTPSFSLGLTDGTSIMDIQQALVTVIGSIPVASVAAPPPAPAAPAPSAPPPAPRPAPAAEAPASAPAPERSSTPTLARMASNAAEATDEAQGDKKSDAEREGVAGLGALLEGRAPGEAAERAVGGRALSALMSGGPSAAGAFSAGAALAVRAADLAEATGLASAWRGPTVTAGDSSSGLRSSYSDTAEARTYSALMQAMNRVREDVTGEEVQVAVT
ncbi:MAG: cadherin domain-containing protein, partial [Rubrivivax sp.]|nr:cadherin domain-containing protein [Rubrivivax sp.]